MWCRTPQGAPASHWKGSASHRIRLKASRRNISGVSAKRASSRRRTRKLPPSQNRPHPEERRLRRVSKDGRIMASWFSWRCEASSSDGALYFVPFANGLAAARPARARAPPHHEEPSMPQRERDQTERADDHAPPRKQRKAAA